MADDVWYEIFLRLPLDSIFRSKSVSKVWLSTLSSPNFINKWYEINKSSLPWALVDYTDSAEDDEKLIRKFAIAYPDSHSHFKSLDPSFTNRNDQERKCLFLLGSSNGLVLCYLKKLSNQNTYCVCNPLTQKWISLPPPPSRKHPWHVTGIMCNDQCFASSLVSTSFRVIRIPWFVSAAKEFKIEVFCSDLGEWIIYHVSFPGDVTWDFSYFDNVITRHGVMYWLQKRSRKILAVSVNGSTNHGYEGRLIDLPDRAMDGHLEFSYRLGESEGLICYAIISKKEKSLSVWVLEDDWTLLYKDDKFHEMLVEMETLLIGEMGMVDLITQIQILGFNPVDKYVVILGYDKYIWAYNTRTKGYEQFCHPSFLRNNVSRPRVSIFTFTLKARPAALPPISWRDASMVDVQI